MAKAKATICELFERAYKEVLTFVTAESNNHAHSVKAVFEVPTYNVQNETCCKITATSTFQLDHQYNICCQRDIGLHQRRSPPPAYYVSKSQPPYNEKDTLANAAINEIEDEIIILPTPRSRKTITRRLKDLRNKDFTVRNNDRKSIVRGKKGEALLTVSDSFYITMT